MKAIAKTKKEKGFEIIDAKIKEPGENEVLIKVKASTICGTDLHIYKWDKWSSERIKIPRIVGHEMSGEIASVGKNVKNLKPGDFVSVETHIICGECYACKNNRQEACMNLKILGIDMDGSYAEYVTLPAENCWKNEKNLPPEIASLKEPLGNAVDTVLSEDVTGKSILITGCGPLGLLSIGVAKVSGAYPIIATEINEYRIKKAKEMGADYVLNPLKDNIYEIVMDITKGNGVDVFCEVSGNEKALIDGLNLTTPGGRVSILGLFKDEVKFDINNLVVLKGLRIYGITGRKIYSTWYKTSALIESGILDISPVLTHKFKLEEFEKAFNLMETGNCGKIAFIID